MSGLGFLDFNGRVNTSAPFGKVGALLLDPTNIEVVTGGTATLVQVDQFADADLSASCAVFGAAACSKIDPVTINVAAANVTLQATKNITFTNAIAMTTAGVGLTATAQTGAITVNAPITTANRVTTGTTGAVTLTAGAAVVVNANITTGSATVADAAGNQAPASGAMLISAGTGVSGSGRLITGAASLTGADAAGTDSAASGKISVTAGTGGVSGGIGLSSANALTVGNASRAGAVADSATAGNIVLSSRDEINNGAPSTGLSITPGVASGATTNTQGTLAVTTSTAAGNAFLTIAGA